MHALRLSYSKGVTNTLYYALGSIAITLPFALGMEWKKLKDSPQHETNEKDAESETPRTLVSDHIKAGKNVAPETIMA